MTFFHGDDGRGRFTTLATGEIEFSELKLVVKGARLTYSTERGFLAYPPRPRGADVTMIWKHGHDMADSARDALLAMYERMGGQKPEGVVNSIAARRRIAERKQDKPVPVRTVDEIDAALPASEMGLSRGLERTLGLAS
jgi:hypothetical protein